MSIPAGSCVAPSSDELTVSLSDKALAGDALAHDSLTKMLAKQPRVHTALLEARERATSTVDHDLLALCEYRIGQLLGVASEPLAQRPQAQGALAQTDRGRAALLFVEQWVIDVANVTDEMVAALQTELGDDRLMDFVHGVLAVEQRIRLDLAWDKLGLYQRAGQ